MRNVRRLLAVCAAAFAVSTLATQAIAQADPNARNATGRPFKPLIAPQGDGKELPSKDLWRKIREAEIPDLKYSEALALNVGTARSAARAKCYTALIKANEQANGAGIKDASGVPIGDPPSPHLVTAFEQAAEIIDNLAPDSPVMLGCSEAAQLLRMTAAEFISSLITGMALLPKVP